MAVFAGGSAFAQRKSCEELQIEIIAKLDANGVKNFVLEIVAAESVKDQKIVGKGGKKGHQGD
jgi:hypothetical protein